MKPETLQLIRDSFRIRRWHTVRTVIDTDTVGHHTAGVMMLLFYIYEEPPLSLIKYALVHDAAEIATGDVPATAKWNWPELAKALDVAEKDIETHYDLPLLPKMYQDPFKFADMMDLCFKCLEEISVGNLNFIPILQRGINYCVELYKNSPNVKKIPQCGELITMIINSPFFPGDVTYDGQTKH